MKHTPGPWVEAGEWGNVGFEVQAHGHSLCIVNKVGAKRLEFLNEKRSASAKRGTESHYAEAEALKLEEGKAEALANAHLIAAAPTMEEALLITERNLQSLAAAHTWDEGLTTGWLKMVQGALAAGGCPCSDSCPTTCPCPCHDEPLPLEPA